MSGAELVKVAVTYRVAHDESTTVEVPAGDLTDADLYDAVRTAHPFDDVQEIIGWSVVEP